VPSTVPRRSASGSSITSTRNKKNNFPIKFLPTNYSIRRQKHIYAYTIMKHSIFIVLFGLMSIICKAQYNSSTYVMPIIVSGESEDDKLDKIRFDDNLLKQNPATRNAYNNYLDDVNKLSKKSKIWSSVAYTGLAIECTAFIPLFMYLNSDEEFSDNPDYSKEDRELGWTIGLASVGFVACITGGCKALSFHRKINNRKKDFIYYLKTRNNGLGIVVLF